MKKLLLAFVITGCGVSAAVAQFDVSPQREELVAGQGEKVKGVFTLVNMTDTDVVIEASAEDWFRLDENKDIAITDWLKLDAAKVIVKADSSKAVGYTVRVPKKASGELAAKISFLPAAVKGGTLRVMLSVSLYVIVRGTEQRDLSIVESVIQNDREGYVAAVVLDNRSNVHVRPSGTVSISKGKTAVKDFEIVSGWPVYPRQKRSYVARWPEGKLKKGVYTADFTVDCGSDIVLKDSIRFKVGEGGTILEVLNGKKK